MVLNLNSLWSIVVINALSVALLLTWYTYGYRSVITDKANNRSLHQGKAVTGGGFLMFLPLCLALLWVNPIYLPAYLLFAMSLLGLADDKFNLSFKLRLIIQSFLLTLCLAYFNFSFGLVFIFLLFASIWWVNLFNFMDGANGMAGLHALVVFVFYLLISEPLNLTYIMSASIAVIIVVYLVFNLYLKKLFMGDSGSLPIAMLLAVLAFGAIKTGLLGFFQVALIHGVFITDATLTLMIRLNNGENVTQAHATHLYQRLIKSQYSHLMVSSMYAMVTALLCVIAFTLTAFSQMVQIVVTIFSYIILIMIFMKYFRAAR